MSFLTQLLEFYHLSLNDLGTRSAPGSFNNLKTPFDLSSFNHVVNRLKLAIKNKEKTVLYGDYDVDGLTSTAILYLSLKQCGLETGYFIPSRYIEGYGLNENRVRQFAEKGYHLIITIDNGITAFDSIALAKELGMEVIVIDHHEVEASLPDTSYIFHQTLSSFTDYNCSAASLAFFVGCSLIGKFDPYFATLAGIAVFSDVMPLVGNNLELVKIMLDNINQNKYSNLLFLLQKNNAEYQDINFKIIPSLNSVGRIQKDSLSTNQACRFLIEYRNEEKIKKFGNFILECNNKRKEAVKNNGYIDKYTLSTEHGICLRIDSFSGLAGLFANKVMREKNIPTAVFSLDEIHPNQLVCSIRCPEGYKITPFFQKYKDKFISFGGHEKAAGMVIEEKQYYMIATLLMSEFAKQALAIDHSDSESCIEINLNDLNEENYHIYESFMPFGEGFSEPTFLISLDKEDLIESKNHTSVFAQSKNGNGKVCFFNVGSNFLNDDFDYIEAKGRFSKEIYLGKVTYQLVVNSYRKVIG